MKLRLNQSTSLKQLQTLSPMLVARLRLFQLSRAELQEFAAEKSQDNPMLDIVRFDQQLAETAASNDRLEQLQPQKSLKTHLRDQLDHVFLSAKDHDIALALIDELSPQGFLSDYPTLQKQLSTRLQVAPRKITEVLKQLQSFEPDGIAARSLQESLLIQVQNHGFANQALLSLLSTVISKHLDDLDKDPKFLASKLAISEDAVLGIKDFIKQNLTPNPAANFSDGPTAKVLIPSFKVQFLENGDLDIENLEKSKGLKLGLSKQNLALLENPNTDAETRAFLNKALAEAKALINDLENRDKLLQQLGHYIIESQSAFLRHGRAYLQPLQQSSLCEKFGLSPSTVSRLVNQKAVETPTGVYPLKWLCPRSHFGKTARQLQLLVQDLAAKYPDESDSQLMKRLHKLGIDMARRTVNKYRRLAITSDD